MRFADLPTAGLALAGALHPFGAAADTLILGLVRGGVPLAVEVAAALDLPLDLAVFRTFFLRPGGDRVRAGRFAGTLAVDDDLYGRSPGEEAFVAEGLAALAARERLCRGSRSAVLVAAKTVLLVDNGMRTGATMRDAIRLIRKLGPARVVAAVPVGPAAAVEKTRPLADELVCLTTPEQLGHVGLAYERFDVPDESRIQELLREHDRVRSPSHVRSR